MLVAAALGFLAALAAGVILTALVRRVAIRIGLTDCPDVHRKLHAQPVPLGGGVAVFLATGGVLAVVLVVPNPWGLQLQQDWRDVLGFLLAGLVVVGVGIADDCLGLRGRQKLFGQVVAASILMASGVLIRRVGIFGYDIQFGLLAVPFTLFWLVGAINAMNLLDGIDGLTTILGIILGGALCAMAAMTGHPAVAMVAVVFTGSLLGFLWFNFPPAKIFLGDAGSMLTGLMIGALAIRASLKGPGTVLLSAPLAIWAIPIFDSAVAILRRKLTGRSIYTTDRGHLHYQLLNRLGTNRKVLAFIAACCLLTSAAALIGVFLKNDVIALVTCAVIVVMFVTTGIFGRGEFLLLASRLRHLGLSFVRPISVDRSRIRQSTVHLQGSKHWEGLWVTLTEQADQLHLVRIRLDLNLPREHEAYNAAWERADHQDFDDCWQLDLPLVVADQAVGRLAIAGDYNGGAAFQAIEPLLHMLEPFEARLNALALESGVPLREPVGAS